MIKENDKRKQNQKGLVTGAEHFSSDVFASSTCNYVYPVVSDIASGTLHGIDFSLSEQEDGFIYGYTAKDIPGKNIIGAVSRSEEPLLAKESVHYIGQPVGFVIARTAASARRAARKARLLITADEKPILTLEEARKRNSYYHAPMKVEDGDIEAGFTQAEEIFEGHFATGGQEHAYLETQRAVASWGEAANIRINCGTQAITDVQQVVALLLGKRESEIEVDVYRVGGAFGGKERGGTMWAAMAALSLEKTHTRSAIILDRADDLAWTGKRHPYDFNYKVGFTKEGVITTLSCDLYANGGYYEDFTEAIMERSVLSLNACYYIKNIRLRGFCCKTNYPANTAFRGFGAPQATMIAEEIIYHVASRTGKSVEEIQMKNFFSEGQASPYGMSMTEVAIPDMYKNLLQEDCVKQTIAEVEAYNRDHTLSKQGVGIVPVKYGIGFTATFLNQGNALVYIYTDGSISVSHGGIEMGQGLFTKIELIVAETLGVSPDHVRCQSTNSLRSGSVSSTAASTGTDINGEAARQAALKIKKELSLAASALLKEKTNLEPAPEYIVFAKDEVWDKRKAQERIPFQSLVSYCYFHRINLGAQSHYATPGIAYDIASGKGTPFAYFTNGVALSVATIDLFTGEAKIDKTIIRHEGGHILDMEIDRGQVIGGFMQGLGYATMEELPYDQTGHLLTRSFSTYKVPLINDMPKLDVELIDRKAEISGVLGSKGVGEPPLLYGVSAFSAIRNAIATATGKEVFLLHPATGEHILSAIRG